MIHTLLVFEQAKTVPFEDRAASQEESYNVGGPIWLRDKADIARSHI